MMAAEILNFRLGMVTNPTELTLKVTPPNGYEFDEGMEFNADLNRAYITQDFYAKAWFEIKLKPIETNPHAALIAQCDDDKKQFPDFWWELWQRKDSDKKWHFIHKESPFFEKDCYRPHPHRASIIQFHQCSDVDKKRWQFRLINTTHFYSDCGTIPQWEDGFEYRLRPRTCQVTINGTVLEYPEPVRVALEDRQEYWFVTYEDVTCDKWVNHNLDMRRLKRGSIHLTEQAAKQHLSVLQAVNAQTAI